MKARFFIASFGLFAFAASSSLALAASGREMSITLPIFGSGRFEYNLGGEASVAIEGSIFKDQEDYSKEELKENNNESLMADGGEVAAYFARYSNGIAMSGLYWALGAGYRKMAVNGLAMEMILSRLQTPIILAPQMRMAGIIMK